jgi:hypothetical protein
MNATRSIVTAICLIAACSPLLFGQGITTLICQGNQTNQVQITSSQYARIKSYWDYQANAGNGWSSFVRIQSGANTIDMPAKGLIHISGGTTPQGYTPDFTIAGPATISLITQGPGSSGNPAILTLDIEPGPYPPGRAVTVGAYSGNVQVTMEMSTDLVNWTPAVNAQVYTNSPDARFFRIKLQTNATP